MDNPETPTTLGSRVRTKTNQNTKIGKLKIWTTSTYTKQRGNQKQSIEEESQYNGQSKRTNNELQNITQKIPYQATQTSLKTGDQLRCFGRVFSPCYRCDIRRATIATIPMISICHIPYVYQLLYKLVI